MSVRVRATVMWNPRATRTANPTETPRAMATEMGMA